MEELQDFADEIGVSFQGLTIGEIMDMWKDYGKGKPKTIMPEFYDPPRATRLQKMKYLYRTGIDQADLVQMSPVQLTKLYRERYGQLGRKMIAPPPGAEVIKTLSASPSPTPSPTPSITTTPSPTTPSPTTTRPNLQEELRKRARGGMTDEEIDKMKRAQKTTQAPFDPSKVTIPPTSLSVEQMKRNLIEKNFSTKRALDKLTDNAIRDLHFYAFGDVAPVVAEPQGFRVEQVEDVVEPVEEQKVEMVKQPVVVPGVDRFTQGVVKTKNSLEPYQNFISKKRATEVIPSQEEQLRSLTNWEMFQIPLDLNSQGVNLSEEMIKQDNKMLQGSTPNDWYDFTRRQYQPVTTFMHGNMDAFKMNVMVASMTPIKEEITLDKYTTNDDVFKDVTENSDFKHQYEAEINGSMMNSPYNNLQTSQTLVGTQKGGVYGDLKKNLNLFLVP
jgi:hypothetical protein